MVGSDERYVRRGRNWEIDMERKGQMGMHYYVERFGIFAALRSKRVGMGDHRLGFLVLPLSAGAGVSGKKIKGRVADFEVSFS